MESVFHGAPYRTGRYRRLLTSNKMQLIFLYLPKNDIINFGSGPKRWRARNRKIERKIVQKLLFACLIKISSHRRSERTKKFQTSARYNPIGFLPGFRSLFFRYKIGNSSTKTHIFYLVECVRAHSFCLKMKIYLIFNFRLGIMKTFRKFSLAHSTEYSFFYFGDIIRANKWERAKQNPSVWQTRNRPKHDTYSTQQYLISKR